MVKNAMRLESDFIGEVKIDAQALYGIHSWRAKTNFPDTEVFNLNWYKALGTTKKALYLSYRDFIEKLKGKYSELSAGIQIIDTPKLNSLIQAATELEEGQHFDQFIVPAISGGAGTSINLNINEILANRALQLLDKEPGTYSVVDPIEHANVYQSTNDVIPTSLKVASIKLLVDLEESINDTRQVVEELERENQNHVRKGFTQMQEAVPTSFGKMFGAYSDALSRDWWRVSKCFERIKVVNLGGSAIGSGITVPRYIIMEVTRKLQELTHLPLTRAENMYDATSNLDSLVEVHGIIKAHAVNLEKMVNDLRLLSSDIASPKRMSIPAKQVGSSIMPGKVNPVIPEFVISCTHRVYANDQTITSLSAQGCLELNAYLPIIGHSLLNSLELLIAANKTIKENLLRGLVVKAKISEQELNRSSVLSTVLVPFIGYNKAADLAKYMQANKVNITEANRKLKLVEEEKLNEILKPDNLLKEGFTMNDIGGS